MSILQEKIKKISGGMKIATVVFCVLIALQMVFAAVIVIGNEIDSGFYFSKYFTGEVTSEICAYITLYAFIIGILIKFYRIFALSDRAGSPFSKAIAARVKSIGVTIIAAAVVVPSVEKALLLHYAPESAAMASDMAPLPFLFFAIVFFFFSILLSYGAELQQQSDETL